MVDETMEDDVNFELHDVRGNSAPPTCKGKMLTFEFRPAEAKQGYGDIPARLNIYLDTGYRLSFSGNALQQIMDKIGVDEVMKRLKGKVPGEKD